jgi:hypothetical protein
MASIFSGGARPSSYFGIYVSLAVNFPETSVRRRLVFLRGRLSFIFSFVHVHTPNLPVGIPQGLGFAGNEGVARQNRIIGDIVLTG